MTTQALSNRLASISENNRTTQLLIHRLAKLPFQPGSVPLDAKQNGGAGRRDELDEDEDDEAGDVRAELTAEIRDGLRLQEEEFELVSDEIEYLSSSVVGAGRRRDTDRDKERTRLNVQAAKLGEDLKHSRVSFRKAQLQAKRNLDLAKQKEREILFAHLRDGPSTPQSESNDTQPPNHSHYTTGRLRGGQLKQAHHNDPEVNGADDVTIALRRMHDLMSTELSRSRFVQETLDQSSAALTELSEHYSGLDSLLSSSRNLLGSLLRSQKSDTWYLETAFYILVTTVVWLLFRSLLYGPLRYFVWFPLKLLWRVVFAVFGAAGLTSDSSKTLGTTGESLSTSRTPLKIQPSATGGPPRRQNMASGGKGVPVGARGGGAKKGHNNDGSLSEQVGRMAEDSQRQDGAEGGNGGKKQEIRRGDGTVLKESDEPRNPKKRMMEEPPKVRKRDEL
jgi:protein transport protein SEC20